MLLQQDFELFSSGNIKGVLYMSENRTMPTVLRKDGFDIRIYPNDHLPAHVHVIKSGEEAKINLGGENESPELLSVTSGMSRKDTKKALEIVTANQSELRKKWQSYHE